MKVPNLVGPDVPAGRFVASIRKVELFQNLTASFLIFDGLIPYELVSA